MPIICQFYSISMLIGIHTHTITISIDNGRERD
jgi:hypothetical protein